MTPHISPLPGVPITCIALLLGISACTPAQKKPVVATAMDNGETRREAFEATLRVLDQHPEYVDEFFVATLRHPKTLGRLLRDTSRALADPQLARRAARHLAAEPDGLKTTLIATLDEIKDKPNAQSAMAQAIELRPNETAAALFTREVAVRKAVTAMLQELRGRPAATEAFMQAMRDNREPLAGLLAEHPDVLKALTGALAERGVNRGKAELSKLGAND